MKKFLILYSIPCILSLKVLLITPAVQAQDVSINVVGTSATIPLSTTGSIQVDICNTDPANVVTSANKLNPQISVGPNVTILGVTNGDGSPLADFSVVSNTGQVIRLTNTVPLPNASCVSFNVIVKGQVIDTPGDAGGISATLDLANSQLVGNRTFNDASTTSVAVIVNPQLGPDMTPVIYARPSSIYGDKPVSLVVEVLELNAIATSGTITVKVTRDPMLSLNFDPTWNLMDGRSVQNSVWNFDTSDLAYYILTTNQIIPPGGAITVGLSGFLNPAATTGILNISSVIINNGNEQKITNNTGSSKIEYFHW